MMNIEPMLTFDGDCSEALEFYLKVFDGKQPRIQTFGDNKAHLAKEHKSVSPRWENKIMHASFVLPNGDKFYMADRGESCEFHQGNADAVAIDFENEADMENILHRLSQDGEIKVALHKTFWHAMYAVVIDKFKKRWVLNCQIVDLH